MLLLDKTDAPLQTARRVLSRVSAALIDLDGTLMDTVADLAQAVGLMREELGLAPLAVARVAAFMGKGSDVLVHRALTNRMDGQAQAALFERGRAAFYRHYLAVNGQQARMFEGVPEALARLRGWGLPLACVTNKPRPFTLPLLERVGLSACFDAVVCGDEVSQAKPHPAMVLEASRRLGVAAGQCILFGDSINDAQAAARAGCLCVLVQTGYNEGEPVSALKGTQGVLGIYADLASAVDALAPSLVAGKQEDA